MMFLHFLTFLNALFVQLIPELQVLHIQI